VRANHVGGGAVKISGRRAHDRSRRRGGKGTLYHHASTRHQAHLVAGLILNAVARHGG
jgi:hypothetical protein